MANLIDEMESRIFAAQMARLSRMTGASPDAAFIGEMYRLVKVKYIEELKKRKILPNSSKNWKGMLRTANCSCATSPSIS